MNTYSMWQAMHDDAMRAPRGVEIPIVKLFDGFTQYAIRHEERYGTPITEDGALGPAWEDVGRALLVLLNGETGRLDCGTLDRAIRSFLPAE